jgi:flavin reductase (DIM6/NTAB) family NADH-FMN oxidoreductase RutF
MEIDPATAEGMYRTVTSIVTPRPIGWISTRSDDGHENVAPYSFFNGLNEENPPVVMFSSEDPAGGGLKDSVVNARETEAFVHNLVTEDLFEEMHATSDPIPPTESEFEHADLATEPARTVDAPRVAAAKAHFECTLYDDARIGDHVVVMGEIRHISVDDSLCTDGKVDIRKMNPVGRLTGDYYATMNQFTVDDGPL